VRRLVPYVIGAVTVRLADEGARIALILLALDRLSWRGAGGVLVAALMLPHVVAAPAIGLLVDRARRPARIIGLLAAGFAISLAVTAISLGRPPFGVSVLVLLVGGACGPALTGALSSQLPRLAAPESRSRAFGVDSLTYNIAGIGGPALVGLTAGFADPRSAMLLMVALAAIGAVMVTFLRVRQEPSPAGPSWAAGIRAIATNRTLATVVLASTAGQLGPGAVPVVIAAAAAAQHRASAAGLMLTVVAIGALVGSLLWTARPAPAARAPALHMLAMCGHGLPLLVGVVTSNLLWLTAALAVSGFFMGPLVGALFTARHALAPDGLKAQVFTIAAGLKITAVAAGAALLGVMAGVPLPIQFALVALNPVTAGLIGLAALKAASPGRL
jgi:predicted MFS family arabinose efflux permease